MSFDGRPHRGFALAGPIYGHPNACAVGNGVSIALAQGYCFGQTQARLIGIQTTRLNVDTPGVYTTNAGESETTVRTTLARFKRYVPTHATHALFDVWCAVLGGESTSVYARITANDGVTTANGTEVNQVLDARAGSELEYGSDVSRQRGNAALTEIRIGASYGGAALVHLRGSVSLATNTLGQSVSFSVEGYAVDADTETVAVRLHTYLAVAWWEIAT